MKPDIKQIITSLGEDITICRLLTDKQRVVIAPYLEVARWPTGSILFAEGDPGDYAGLVISGRLEVKKQTEFEGRQFIVAILSRGAFVGELTLMDRLPRSATVQALEDTELLVLHRDAVERLTHEQPETAIALLRAINHILSLRLRKSVERMAAIF